MATMAPSVVGPPGVEPGSRRYKHPVLTVELWSCVVDGGRSSYLQRSFPGSRLRDQQPWPPMSGGFLQVPPVGDQPPGRLFVYQTAKSSRQFWSPRTFMTAGTGELRHLHPSQGWSGEEDLHLLTSGTKAGMLLLHHHSPI